MDKYSENRATIQSGCTAVDNNCENCGDPLLFAMEDKHHKFSLGLFTVLQCLRVAELEGYLPELPNSWWISVDNTYNTSLLSLANEGDA